MANYSWLGLPSLMRALARVADPDPTPLLTQWQAIIAEDNRRGVLAGTDKDGNPMPRVTYRPKGKRKLVTKTRSNGTRGVFAGLGPHAAGLNNNLTSAEYRGMTGPPLAPRGASSRVITNLETGQGEESPGRWFAVGAWNQVVSTRGVPFLEYHFDGIGQKRRDLRGVRPWGIQQAGQAVIDWAARLLKGQA